MPLKFENESALKDAIKSLHEGTQELTWILASHVDNQPDLVKLVAKGKGEVEELASHLSDHGVSYALVRLAQKIDLSNTVKFVYIYFIGENVPALQKGRIGTAQSDIKQLFSPTHVDFEFTNPNEISTATIVKRVNENSGKSDNVREVSHDSNQHERGFTSSSTKTAAKKTSNFGFQGQAGEAAAGSGVKIDSSVTDAAAQVFNDKSELNWLLAIYQDNDVKKPLVLQAQGKGGVDELSSHLNPDLIAYGLIRVVDIIEGIKTVKFAFVYFIGADVSIMKKAKVSTNKGAVTAALSPHHVALEISSVHELSDEILLQKVQETTGSKSKVK